MEKTYDVHKSMHGDGRDYEPGDKRTMAEADAIELVNLGALAAEGEEPRAREPGVVHTFGKAAPSGHLTFTTTTSDAQEIAVVEAAERRRKAAAAPASKPAA